MFLVCLDFEGVLIPDIWPHIAKCADVPELKLTTRDIKNYRELMDRRVSLCHANGITLKQIQTWISALGPYPGAVDFVAWLKQRYQFIILSDTFYEFVPHFMAILGHPSLFCHNISFNQKSAKLEYRLRLENQKAETVKSLRALHFKVFSSGDSYNDVSMLREADGACLFRAPPNIVKDYPGYRNVQDYSEMRETITGFFGR